MKNVNMYNRYVQILENYKLINKEKVIFLGSGGKDATIGLYFLSKYIEEKKLDIELTVVLVEYPKHVYYDSEGNRTQEYMKYLEYCKTQEIDLKVYSCEQEDFEDNNLKGCYVCKQSRKNIIDKVLEEYCNKEGNVTIFTGYTLFDIMAYLEEFLILTNYTLTCNLDNNENYEKRIKNCLHKMAIREKLPNGNEIVRPLVFFKETDIKEYLIQYNIPYIKKECKVGKYKHKRAYFKSLEILDEINNVTYDKIMKLLEEKGVKIPENFDDIESNQYFIDC